MTTEWRDLSAEIRAGMQDVAPRFKLAAHIAEDPAVTLVGIDLDRNDLIVRHDAELHLKTAGALCGFSGSFARVTDAVPATERFLVVKRAMTVDDATSPLMAGFNKAQELLGGPNSLTTTLVGSGLGAGLGYGTGHMLNYAVPRVAKFLLPEHPLGKNGPSRDEIVDNQLNFVPLMTGLGAGAGALPGLIRGGTALANGHSPLSAYPWMEHPAFTKAAEDAGALFVPSIPVDAFNRAVWSDVQANPFGTRSRWGDNNQPMHTPPQAAALASGLVSAASGASGADFVSPWDVARVAGRVAVNAGLGGLYGTTMGLTAGKVLGALAGLSPEAQDYVKQTGLWAGLMTGVAKSLF